jgi:hypothetical protein
MTAETAADVQLRSVDRQDFERRVLAGDSVDLRGRFGWVTDPEGNRVELWQPA